MRNNGLIRALSAFVPHFGHRAKITGFITEGSFPRLRAAVATRERVCTLRVLVLRQACKSRAGARASMHNASGGGPRGINTVGIFTRRQRHPGGGASALPARRAREGASTPKRRTTTISTRHGSTSTYCARIMAWEKTLLVRHGTITARRSN